MLLVRLGVRLFAAFWVFGRSYDVYLNFYVWWMILIKTTNRLFLGLFSGSRLPYFTIHLISNSLRQDFEIHNSTWKLNLIPLAVILIIWLWLLLQWNSFLLIWVELVVGLNLIILVRFIFMHFHWLFLIYAFRCVTMIFLRIFTKLFILNVVEVYHVGWIVLLIWYWLFSNVLKVSETYSVVVYVKTHFSLTITLTVELKKMRRFLCGIHQCLDISQHWLLSWIFPILLRLRRPRHYYLISRRAKSSW